MQSSRMTGMFLRRPRSAFRTMEQTTMLAFEQSILSLLKTYFSIYLVGPQAVPDIDHLDLAVLAVLNGPLPAQVDAVGIRNPKYDVVVDVGINRPVVAEDPLVVIGTGDVVDIIAADLQRSVLRGDVNGARVHQQVHRRGCPVGITLPNLIVIHHTRGRPFHFFDKMDAHADGRVSVIDETVPGNPIIRPLALDAGAVFQRQVHPLERAIQHPGPPRMVVGHHASPVTILEAAFLDIDPIGIDDMDGVALEVPEGATAHRSFAETVLVEADRAVLSVFRPAAGIPFDDEARQAQAAEIAVREVENGRRHRTICFLDPEQAETGTPPSVSQVAVDIVNEPVFLEFVQREIDVSVLDPGDRSRKGPVPGGNLNVQFSRSVQALAGPDTALFVLRIHPFHILVHLDKRARKDRGSRSAENRTVSFEG